MIFVEGKILIVTKKQNNLLDSLKYFFDQEKIEYMISDHLHSIEKDITNLIYFNLEQEDTLELPLKSDLPMIIVEGQKQLIKNSSNTINYIITSLIQDEENYTEVQKEYLFKKGIYHIFLQKVRELLENINHYNHIIYDLTEIEGVPDNWTFNFESISETYAWLSRKNKSLPSSFPRKVINFYDDKVYDDSLKEINYLTEKVVEIKNHMNVIDLFILTEEEFSILKHNYFFKLLLKHISDTYSLYLIDRKKLEKEEPTFLQKMLDGIVVYDDCVYRDTYQDEFSLGYVDCNQATIDEYNEIFDYIMNTYGYKVNSESDGNEFFG